MRKMILFTVVVYCSGLSGWAVECSDPGQIMPRLGKLDSTVTSEYRENDKKRGQLLWGTGLSVPSKVWELSNSIVSICGMDPGTLGELDYGAWREFPATTTFDSVEASYKKSMDCYAEQAQKLRSDYKNFSPFQKAAMYGPFGLKLALALSRRDVNYVYSEYTFVTMNILASTLGSCDQFPKHAPMN